MSMQAALLGLLLPMTEPLAGARFTRTQCGNVER